MTLNNIIDDILLTARNGQLAHADKLSRNQIGLWIHQYRARLIKERIDKEKGAIPEQYTQVIPGLQLRTTPYSDSIPTGSKRAVLESIESLPKLMILHGKPSVLGVWDAYGNDIQIGNRHSANYQKHRKYTCNDYIAYLQGDKLRIDGPNMIDYVDVKVIVEDPTASITCYNSATDPYPIPEEQIPLLKNLIYIQELGMRNNAKSDTITNSQDDTLNNAVSLPTRDLTRLNRQLSQ